MLRRIIIASILVILSLCTGCESSLNNQEPYDQDLLAYLPQSVQSFYGEASYYHEFQNIQMSDDVFDKIVIISGEVKDLTKGFSKKDYSFEIKYVVDHEKIVQTIDKNVINDSAYKEIVLLKLPLILDASWQFKTKTFDNKTQTITANIIEYDQYQGIITVEYSGENQYYEVRHFQKNIGITSFTKLVTYKNAKAITGYHLYQSQENIIKDEIEALDETLFNYEMAKEIPVDAEYFELIELFNLSWVKLLNEQADDIYKIVKTDSEAFKKLELIEAELIDKVEFLGFKPTAISETSTQVKIKVLELYRVADREINVNNIEYTIDKNQDTIEISDFN